MRALLLALGLLAALAGPLLGKPQGAGDGQGTLTLEVRVASAERGWARIDRGSADGLALDDVVLFQPREGGTYRGTVTQLDERSARVELADTGFLPAPGTRGKVSIPRSRSGAAPRPRLRPAPGRAPDALPPPTFENQDEDWRSDEPLLARVRPLRPAERATRLRARSYALLDYTRASEDERSSGIARVGGSLEIDNPFGAGGKLLADGEWGYHTYDVPDDDDEEDVELRLERLSYAWGGTRFESDGYQVGRFLQGGMPEFGVLDGAEWVTRGEDGQRFGASIGFLPEPDEEFQTGSDFQLAAFYRWVADESEQTAAAFGYQKTFHNAAADRDLLVASYQRLPRTGWTVFATAWVDVYTDGDDEKGTLLGLTQAYLSSGRRFADGSSLDLVFSHLEFPEIDRDEFLPVTDQQLADDHNERLSLVHRLQWSEDVRMRSALGGWVDEDEEGGDGEFGFALDDFLFERAFADVAAFSTRGRFQSSVGGRGSFGRYTDDGRWAFDYEFSQNRLDGFSSANDDLPQHRLRFSRDHAWKDWNLSWRIEGLLYDDENALTLGLYLQRSHY